MAAAVKTRINPFFGYLSRALFAKFKDSAICFPFSRVLPIILHAPVD
jgi:hypothetical protein